MFLYENFPTSRRALRAAVPVCDHRLKLAGSFVVVDEGAADRGLPLTGLVLHNSVSHIEQFFPNLKETIPNLKEAISTEVPVYLNIPYIMPGDIRQILCHKKCLKCCS